MEFVPAKVTCQHWVTGQNGLLEPFFGERHMKSRS